MAKKKINVFKKKVTDIFGPVDSYRESVRFLNVLEFRVMDWKGISFEHLEKLSKLTKTRKININGGALEGCPT